MRHLITLAAVFALATFAFLPAASARTHRTTATTVGVTASEFKFKLTRKVVRRGTVVFKVRNAGKVPHDFKINHKRTPLLGPGHRATLRVVFKKRGKYRYLCTVSGHATLGMKGLLTVR